MTDSHWKARRLAARAQKVAARHADEPAIAAYGSSLAPKADAFILSYDTAAKHQVSWRRETAEGRGAMASLEKEVDAWKPHVARERPGFDLTTIADRPTVPEDLVQDAIALAEELDAVVAPDGTTPAWATAAATTVRGLAADAERETDQAAAADAVHNEQLADVRAKKATFDAELSLFRNTLRAVLGRSHPDFQKLRANKAATPDPEDDPSAPAPSDPVTPEPTPPS